MAENITALALDKVKMGTQLKTARTGKETEPELGLQDQIQGQTKH